MRGRAYHVFDELELRQASAVPSWRTRVTTLSPDDVDALVDRFVQAGHNAEDWRGNTRNLCRACSEGRVHSEHELPAGWRPREIGVVGRRELADELLRSWAADGEGRVVGDLEPLERPAG